MLFLHTVCQNPGASQFDTDWESMTAVLLHTLAHTVSILQSFILFHTLSIHIHIFHKSCFNLHLVERERAIYPFYTSPNFRSASLLYKIIVPTHTKHHWTLFACIYYAPLTCLWLEHQKCTETHTRFQPSWKFFYGALFSIWFHRLITLFCWYVLRLFRQTNNAHHLSDN